jgi:hypothetical protein
MGSDIEQTTPGRLFPGAHRSEDTIPRSTLFPGVHHSQEHTIPRSRLLLPNYSQEKSAPRKSVLRRVSWEESPRNGRTEAWSHPTKTNTIARQIPAQSMSSCKETVSSSSSNLKLFDRPSLSHSIKVVSQFQHHANGFRRLQFKIFNLVRLQRRRGATYCLCQQSIPLMLHATIANHICSGLSGVEMPMRTLMVKRWID